MGDVDKPSRWIVLMTAIQFLTRIPVTGAMSGTAEYYYDALRRSVLYFPLVGGFIGLFTASIVLLVGYGLSPLCAALIAIGLEAVLTGAFHEDAFADTWDALGGGWTREQVLEIMKDSRLGTYGTLALIVGVGLRVAAVASLLPMGWEWTLVSIVAASTLSRMAIVGMMVTTAPITDRDSQAKDVSGMQTWKTFVLAAVLTTPMWIIWIILSPIAAALSLVIALIALIWFRRKVLTRVGGTTGDLLGCSAYLVQIIILVGSTWGSTLR